MRNHIEWTSIPTHTLHLYLESLSKGLSNVAEVGFTVWLKHKKINVSNSRVSKLLIVPTDVLRQHEIVTTDVVNVHKYYIDLLEFRSSTGSIGKHWREFVNEAALVKSVKVVAECLAVRLIFVIILTLSATVNGNLNRDTMNTWTTKAPMISAIMSQLFNHTRYKKDLLLELLTVARHRGLSNVAEVGFTVWLKHKKINVSNSRVSKLLIVPTDVLRQHEIVTTDVVNVHKYYIDLLEFRSSTGSIGKHWREFVNEAALVKSVKVVAECLAVRLIFVIILTLSATVNENLNRDTMNTWTTKAPMISAIMSQLFNHTRYKKDLLLELLTVASHILLYGTGSRPTTLGEAFSFARIAEACFEDERSTIAIAKPKELTTHVHVQYLEQTTQGRGDEPNRILLVTIHHMIYPITMEVLNQIFSPHGYVEKIEELQENQEEHICYYYWENCFSILNVEEADNTKSPLSADTFGNNGVDESETSGPKTPAKEVVDNANGSALICLVGYDTGSEVVTGLPEEFQEGDMVDAVSRVLKQKNSEKGVDSGSRRRDYTLFGASLFAFLNFGPGYFARRRI
ncbi:polypyrimidine tract-binding protein homolog 3 [Tanacetum coccineum]